MFNVFMKFVISNFPDYEKGSEYLCEDGLTFMFKENDNLKTVIYNTNTKRMEIK